MNKMAPWPLLLAALLLVGSPSHAREAILGFDSTIRVRRDGSVRVRETIRVRAEGRSIRRGIYRDVPTRYEDRLGRNYTVDFSLKDVRRNGRPEPHFTRDRAGGVRVYAGREERAIPTGVHTYDFEYVLTRAVGFFDDHDELYWNVTGHGWSFPILRASATVHLPGPVRPEQRTVRGYTGRRGARGDAYRVTQSSPRTLRLETTEPLESGEGFTVAIGWPKGLVTEPSLPERLNHFLHDNAGLVVGFLGWAAVLMYYLASWVRVGIDPEAGTIVPLYDPPEGLSPAAARYVSEMGYDDEAFTAAVLNMAVKGHLTVEERDGDYTLRRTENPTEGLSEGENAAAEELFAGGDVLRVDSENHRPLREAQNALEESLEDGYRKRFFLTNTSWVFLGGALSLLFFGIALFTSSLVVLGLFGFMTVWLSVWTVGVAALLKKARDHWRRFFRRRRPASLVQALFTSGFAVPFVAGEFLGFGMLLMTGEYAFLALFVMFIGLNLLFYVLLKAPTVQGRRLMDRIEGFRRYLSVAERHRLNQNGGPERTPRLFERYLPYAVALGVETAWARAFSDVLDPVDETGEGSYRPTWYSGSFHDASGLASSLSGSLAPTLASSSTAPGSSSGIGGGGFSGGGAGGGGGGGW